MESLDVVDCPLDKRRVATEGSVVLLCCGYVWKGYLCSVGELKGDG